MRRVLLLLPLALFGCGDGEDAELPIDGNSTTTNVAPVPSSSAQAEDLLPTADTVSDACAMAMSAAADESDFAAAEPLIAATLEACPTVADWLAALNRYPAAMGMTAEAELGRIDVQSACGSYPEAAMCLDAARLGVRP